ncbi:hypothetical protein [Bacillus sp. FJAT-27445]|uniref:hypothetical protein n=1 Tax=Bacillus sp. FJAT-27445 TaxID=1679166 RepID=UPI00074397B6|nr:hypothetical protein [Bacillus sp. FJAT-27445]
MELVYEGIATAILMAGIVFAVLQSNKKSKDKKLRVWGKTTMLIIAPFFSWLVGRLYAISEGSGFAMVGVLMIMFPILFVLGFILYWKGA